MNSGFAILEHPADLGIEAFGASLREAFEQAAEALMSIVVDVDTVTALEERHVELAAADVEHLLVKWLTEVLYLYDGQQFVGKTFVIGRLTPTAITATIRGEQLAPERHQTKLDVKAVTYHQLSVSESEGAAKVMVFLDI